MPILHSFGRVGVRFYVAEAFIGASCTSFLCFIAKCLGVGRSFGAFFAGEDIGSLCAEAKASWAWYYESRVRNICIFNVLANQLDGFVLDDIPP